MPDKELIRRGDALDCFMGLDRTGDIMDAIAALPAVVPAVRPLVWEPWEHGHSRAKTAIGTYSTWSGYWRAPDAVRGIASENPEADAQAHHDAAIRGELTTAPAPDAAAIREVALREALNSLPENDGDDHDEYDLVGRENIGKQRGVEAYRSAILAMIPTAKGGE